ncbi:MAG: serine/threonine protein kinase [Acidobacteria bacterium]|nr:serine/threonine protein kinase [Acidobacteriota bacterium]
MISIIKFSFVTGKNQESSNLFYINSSAEKGIKIAVRLTGEKMIENGTLLQDRYLIEKQIGAGGMGAVYLAVDQRFGSHVAIKETFYKNDELGEAFEREARLLNSLLHPVLPHVSDFFTENNGHFLVMQFIEGEDLFEVLKRKGAFPARDALRWTDSLLDALDYLHSHEPPIIHRDIKPQNLKITPRGDVILLDFGLAKLNSDDTQGALSVFGYSRKYSPLEQIQGTGTDTRSDLFALAATTYHLLTGKPPLEALARASAIVAGNADPLPLASELNSEISVGVSSVLNSALALNPAQRFVTAKAMRQALEHTIKSDLTETVEQLPPTALAVATNGVLVNSAETKDFPALESFAGKVKNLPQTDDTERLTSVEILPPGVQTSSPVPEMTQAASVIEVPTEIVSPASNRSRFPLAAVAALLFFVVVAAGYFINQANSSTESNEMPVVQQAQELNTDTVQSGTVLDSSEPEVFDPPPSKNIEQAEVKPASIKTTTVAKQSTIEKRKTVDEPIVQTEFEENSKPAPVQAEILPPVAARRQTPRRSRPQSDGVTQSRVVESQSAPDIESIFTGRPTGRGNDVQQRREERRREREQMSDEEWRETRRQRKQERRQRQNNQPFPF